MKPALQQQLFESAPLLFTLAAAAPKWKIDAPDDLYPFLSELVAAVEKFNRRYSRRRVRVLKIAVHEGVLECVFNRHVPCIEKLVAATRRSIRDHRKPIRDEFLERAKKMQSTALFGSRLLPEWRRIMPDERATLAKILQYAERSAVSGDDWRCLADWYRKILRDPESAQRCENIWGKQILMNGISKN